MSVREGLEFETQIASDTAPLNDLVQTIVATTADVHVLRDPTRGGISSALTEIAQTAQVGISLDEAQIPFVPPAKADRVLAAMRSHPLGKESAIRGCYLGSSRLCRDENADRGVAGG
jgi:hydrogenase expression/formation protein HypE